ncbi:hypothetical protein M422DRAFT_248363 [Sphaerobolus stellatus SS14]|uniref:Uncharacterized protein n=1 Tax=Sphaerobolus stellatus (strain SS14) TaxID=990650 RepID=A0A0C9VVS1_SPHS4|nr:hypothetical protein M422DRAFT_248363 [Sphaerobolus stellatus SS14]
MATLRDKYANSGSSAFSNSTNVLNSTIPLRTVYQAEDTNTDPDMTSCSTTQLRWRKFQLRWREFLFWSYSLEYFPVNIMLSLDLSAAIKGKPQNNEPLSDAMYETERERGSWNFFARRKVCSGKYGQRERTSGTKIQITDIEVTDKLVTATLSFHEPYKEADGQEFHPTQKPFQRFDFIFCRNLYKRRKARDDPMNQYEGDQNTFEARTGKKPSVKAKDSDEESMIISGRSKSRMNKAPALWIISTSITVSTPVPQSLRNARTPSLPTTGATPIKLAFITSGDFPS